MSGYEKRILYFDEIENGKKVRNAGFTKLILQGEQCRLSVNISGLHKTDTIKCDLVLLEDEKEVALNRINLQQGRCTYSCLLTREQLGERGIQLEDAYGICVRLSEQRFLKAVWRERRRNEPPKAEEVEAAKEEMPDGSDAGTENAMAVTPKMQEVPGTREMTEEQQAFGAGRMPEVLRDPEMGRTPEVRRAAEIRTMPAAQKEPEVYESSQMSGESEAQGESMMSKIPKMQEKQKLPEAQEQPEMYEMPKIQQNMETQQTTKVHKAEDLYGIPERDETEKLLAKRISDDKWKQLERVFPLIHPFGDEREYLSIAPKDFIVLTREYQALANNSFLLHGFYNYHHIILGKIPIGGKERFFLGVPGVFYEREKAVAIMFGFESFECAKEPADTGTFGYYMKRVEI